MPNQRVDLRQSILLALGAGVGQIPIIEGARRRGLGVVTVDPNPQAPGHELAIAQLVCDLGDTSKILAFARERGVSGVATFAADYPMPTLAMVARELRLPGPDQRAVARATDKYLMRIALREAGLPVPEFCLVESESECVQKVESMSGQVVIKPSQSSGGRGITMLALPATAMAIAQAYRAASVETRDRRSVVVEYLVEGPEFSVEGFVRDGEYRMVAITDKYTTGVPHFVEIGHSQPSLQSREAQEALRRTAAAATYALGLDNTVCHTEIKLAASGPVVIESAARAGGGCISSHLVPLSTGFDMGDCAVALAMGLDVPSPPLHQPQAASIAFLTAEPGKIIEISGLESARSMAGVVEVMLYKQESDYVGPLLDSRARCGHVIAVDSTPSDAYGRARSAKEQIRLVTIPESF